MTERVTLGHPLWAMYEKLAMGLGLSVLATICMIWLPFAMLLYPVLPPRLGQAVGRQAIMLGFRLYLGILSALCACRFDLSELDRLRDAGPLIIAANHPSLLDAVLIVSRLPNAVCVMKASLMDKLLFGAAARLARYIRNDGALQIVRQSRASLQEGAQIVIFPEGSRTRNFPLDTLGATLAIIARRSNTPVQSVLLEFSSPYLGKDWSLFRSPKLPLVCRARLGRRFGAPTDHQAFTGALERYFREELGAHQPVPAVLHD